MSDLTTKRVIEAIIAQIDIPDSSYELTEKRYKDLAEWFDRPQSRCSIFDPHLYIQGSFRLGTVIRPLDENGEYDLDMACRLRTGITKATHTQKQLKHLVGDDLEDYRVARNIKEEREEKHRCWRLKYADTLTFHLDAVPSIPAVVTQRQMIKEAMTKAGSVDVLAGSVAEHAVTITDNRHAKYDSICSNWRLSNSEGYALWFEARMELATVLLEKWASAARAAKIDKFPSFKRKSPLQQCVQLLKRHRDVMFSSDPDGKPISAIITTLAAAAYNGEVELDDALAGILDRMGDLVRPIAPHVPNPVNPEEDFADRWDQLEYRELRLADKFRQWLAQAKIDLNTLQKTRSSDVTGEILRSAFEVHLSVEAMSTIPGLVAVVIAPKSHDVSTQPAKPWCGN
jgi:hypothetical protein